MEVVARMAEQIFVALYKVYYYATVCRPFAAVRKHSYIMVRNDFPWIALYRAVLRRRLIEMSYCQSYNADSLYFQQDN